MPIEQIVFLCLFNVYVNDWDPEFSAGPLFHMLISNRHTFFWYANDFYSKKCGDYLFKYEKSVADY